MRPPWPTGGRRRSGEPTGGRRHGGEPTRGRRTATAALALTLAAGGLGACGAGAPRPADPVRVSGALTSGAAALSAPADCPGVTYPPAAPYGLTVSGTITGSLTIRRNDNNRYPSIVPDIRATFCGSLDVPGETGSVPAADIRFAPAHLYLGYHKDKKGRPTYVQEYGLKLIPIGTATATVLRTGAPDGAAADGGLELQLNTEVTTVVSLSTARCADGPVSLTLTTEAPGGSALSGPLLHASAVVVQSGFTVPAVAAQSTCTLSGIPYWQTLNATLFLPAKDTSTSETFSLAVKN